MQGAAIEAFVNAGLGLVISWAATFWLLPVLFGLAPSAGQSAGIVGLFFGLSFVRGFALRLVFARWSDG